MCMDFVEVQGPLWVSMGGAAGGGGHPAAGRAARRGLPALRRAVLRRAAVRAEGGPQGQPNSRVSAVKSHCFEAANFASLFKCAAK